MNLAPFPVPSVGAALTLMQRARRLHLSASYHPNGGMTTTSYKPVTHTVWVMGTPEAIRKLEAK
jgi:hypothetical protein